MGYIHIHRRSRLCENRIAENIEKQKTSCPIFLDYLSFFVEEPPLYLLQGGRKLALIIIHIYISIYIRSRLRERQTAPNIENAEIGVQYFWIIYLFCDRHSALFSTGWP